METLKDPGIAIDQIRLVKSHVEMVANSKGKPEYNPCLTYLNRFESEDGKNLDLLASFDLMHGMENPLFKFTCQFVVRYTRQDSSMVWKDFTSPVALAHIIPYLREYVSNITNRLPTPVLLLNPINTHAMIAEYEDRKRRAEQAKASAQVPQKPV